MTNSTASTKQRSPVPRAPTPRGPVGQARRSEAIDAATYLDTRWRQLDRPLDLAALAWELQREYGAEITDDWFGFGTFKRFLSTAIPEGEITTGRQAYLLPSNRRVGRHRGRRRCHRGRRRDERRGGGGPQVGRPSHRPGAPPSRPHLPATCSRGLDPDCSITSRRPGAVSARSPRPTDWPVGWSNRPAIARPRPDLRSPDVTSRPSSETSSSKATVEPRDADDLAESYATLTQQRLAELRLMGTRDRSARATVRRWIAS